MARIQNLSGLSTYGCTQVVIDRAGQRNANPSSGNTNIPKLTLMDKTFHVLPTTNNPSGSIISLYSYTTSGGQWMANFHRPEISAPSNWSKVLQQISKW